MSEIVIGVDGGGSKTRVMLGTAEGEVLADVTGPKSAVVPGQAEKSAGVIVSLISQALSEIAQPGPVFPRVLYCGVAGMGSSANRRAPHTALDSIALAASCVFASDCLSR